MPRVVVVQPDGRLAVWSSVVDHFVVRDATEDEIVDYELKNAKRRIQTWIASCRDEPMLTYRECLERLCWSGNASFEVRCAAFAELQGVVLNPDAAVVARVTAGLEKNILERGRPFCPCLAIPPGCDDQDLCCPCVSAPLQIAEDGRCRCGLFIAGTPPS